jgi:cardiolipin synthase
MPEKKENMEKIKVNNFNIANMFSFFRIFSVPLLLWLLYLQQTTFFLIIFTLSGLTDLFDGYCARKFNCQTDLGKMLDPIADKILLSSILFGMHFFYRDLVPLFVPIIVFARDVFIVLGFFICQKIDPNIQVKPTLLGKISTLVQLLFVLSVFFMTGPMKNFMIVFTMVITIFSGLQYALIAMFTIQNKKNIQ